jgi:hypothetical protein
MQVRVCARARESLDMGGLLMHLLCTLLLCPVIPLVLDSSLASAEGALPAEDVDRLVACMHHNGAAGPLASRFRIESFAIDGEQQRIEGRLYIVALPDSLKATLRIDAPPELQGVSYLLRESQDARDVYVHLPALNRTRRVIGADLDLSIPGTALSYNELRRMVSAFDLTWLGFPVTRDGRPVERLVVWPQAGMPTAHQQVRAWVDRRTCVPLQIELMTQSGDTQRIIVDAQSIRRVGEHWMPTDARAHDSRGRMSARLQLLELEPKNELPAALFQPSSFHLLAATLTGRAAR